MMDAGALDRRVAVLRAPIVDDGFAAAPGVPQIIGHVWASRRDVSDAERFKDGAANSALTTRFQVRWSPFTAAIRASDLLQCDGQTFGVVGVKHIGRREGLEISAMLDGA